MKEFLVQDHQDKFGVFSNECAGFEVRHYSSRAATAMKVASRPSCCGARRTGSGNHCRGGNVPDSEGYPQCRVGAGRGDRLIVGDSVFLEVGGVLWFGS